MAARRTKATFSGRGKKLRRFSLLRLLLLLVVYGVFAGAGALYYGVVEFSRDLPQDLTAAVEYRPDQATQVYAADGELIGEFFLVKRFLVPPERIPDHVRDAFVAAEDGRFWLHPGFDIMGIARAAYTNYRSGAPRQGASTITQQVTRMLLLSPEKSYDRKIKELILSLRIERELSKRDILHIYLSHAYLGSGAYGVAAGAEVYFGKDVEELTVAEAALLAGLVQAPTRYAPVHDRDIKAARARQSYVLDRMEKDGYLSAAEHAGALAEPIALARRKLELNSVAAPYFVELVRRWATRRFGYRSVFHGGLRIHTTLDSRMQRIAEVAVRSGLNALDRRIGFRGPIGALRGEDLERFRAGPLRPYVPGKKGVADLTAASAERVLLGVTYVGAVIDLRRGNVIVDVGPDDLALVPADAELLQKWRTPVDPTLPKKQQKSIGLQIGDLLPIRLAGGPDGATGLTSAASPGTAALARAELAEIPDVQSALVALDPHTGQIKAMVGGYDYNRSQFNRAVQARRQIGSAIKPFIYATAMGRGTTQLDEVIDAPVSVATAGGVWSPKNYDNKYRGRITLRTALAKSLNTVSVRLLLAMGVDRLIETLRAVGIGSPIPRHISIALGTPDLTLLEVSAGYASLASGGLRVKPRLVDLVTDNDGQVIEDHRDRRPTEKAISPQLAYLATTLMEAVIKRGTGRRAQVLGRPVAGKTGTSSDHRDAWFFGFTTDLLCGVWVGRDDFTPIGAEATGGGAALPIWVSFMQDAHPDTPPRRFPPPDDIVWVRASEETGNPMPAASPEATWVPFARGTVPARFSKGVGSVDFATAPRFPNGPP